MEKLFKKIIFGQGSDVSLLIGHECDARPLVVYCPTTNLYFWVYPLFFVFKFYTQFKSRTRLDQTAEREANSSDLDTSRSWFGPKTRFLRHTKYCLFRFIHKIKIISRSKSTQAFDLRLKLFYHRRLHCLLKQKTK